MPYPLYYTDGKVGVGVPNPEVELDVLGDLAVSGTITSGGAPVGGVTFTAVGSTPSADGASVDGSEITLQPADGTHPGVVTSGAQTIGGAKTFSGAITASNLSGTNTGDVTLTAVGAVPSANAASLSGQALTLQPADATHPGVVTTAAQTLAGIKTFSSAPVSANGFLAVSGAAGGLSFDATELYIKTPNNGGEIHLQTLGGTELGKINGRGYVTNFFLTMAYTDSTASPGSATINKATGRSAIASGQTTCVITNAFCQAASVVMVTPEDGLDTVVWCKCVPTDGSFTVTVKTDPGATWKFRWVVFNSIG